MTWSIRYWNLFRSVLMWGSLALLFTVTLETTCRLEDWVQYRTPLLSPFTAQDQLIIRDADGVHGRPNARFQKWAMNSLGLRGPEVPAHKNAGILRVATVGASETFGLYESPNREYPRQLEDTLIRLLASPDCISSGVGRVEVLNAAFPGMSFPTQEQDVRNRLSRLGLDVIVVYPSPVQYLEDRAPEAALPDSSGRPSSRATPSWLSLRVLPRLREQLKQLLPAFLKAWLRAREVARRLRSHPPGWQFTAVPSERLAAYEADLRRLIGSARRLGAVPVVAVHANVFALGQVHDPSLLGTWARFYPRASGRTIVAFDSAAASVTARVGEDSGVAVVDTRAALSRLGVRAFADYAHFTDAGAGAVAGAVARASLMALSRASRPACTDRASPAGYRRPE